MVICHFNVHLQNVPATNFIGQNIEMSSANPWTGPIGVYDFLNESNVSKWGGWLQPGLCKVRLVVVLIARPLFLKERKKGLVSIAWVILHG